MREENRMIRSFKYRLYPTKKQEILLEYTLKLCRILYNAALEERISAWKKNKISIQYYDQLKSLTNIRSFDKEYQSLSSHAERSALYRVDIAFKAFFRRIKNGKAPGFPRFKSIDRYNSFDLNAQNISIKNKRVRVPKIGCIKLNQYRLLQGKTLGGKIKKEAGKWYVIFEQDIGIVPIKINPVRHIGIDLGLTVFATFSDGNKINNPKYYKNGEKQLINRQRRLSQKKKGSNNRKKAKLLLQKSYIHIRNQRLDFSRKLAKNIINKYDLIALEKLNIQNMTQDSILSKSIYDAGWGIFQQALACKAEEAGKTLVFVDPKNTSQMCSSCGKLVPKDLSVRIHECSNCGLVLDRDHNAALNILSLGLSEIVI